MMNQKTEDNGKIETEVLKTAEGITHWDGVEL